MKTIKRCLFVIAGLVLASSPTHGTDDSHSGSALDDLFAREWQARIESSPYLASAVGIQSANDRLPAVNPRELSRQNLVWRGFLEELDALDRTQFSREDHINAQIFRAQLEDRVANFESGAYQIPFNADSGFYSGFARLPSNMPFRTMTDYANYVARLRAWPTYVDEQIANMQAGLDRGFSQPRAVLEGIEAVFESHIVGDPTESVFYQPVAAITGDQPGLDRHKIEQDVSAAIVESIVPTYVRLRDFFVENYIPNARETLGASDLPNGASYYQQRIRHYTTLDLTADEIHQLGKEEVARIRSEMDAIIDEVGFDGTFAEFLEFLRTDPRFYAKTAEELIKEASYIAKRMDGKLPALFKTLPRLPYTVEPVPADIAPKYTAGRAVSAPLGSTQPGRYWVNTYALETRPLYNLEALTLHEAVPGHHLQIALSQELENLPNFRRFSYLSAFGEGWGLYSEWLGLEAGFYQDPYSNFGRLTYEMWRACRLVVDTGVHAMGWTRQQMIDFLASNTALSLHEVTTETDRYISWPAQALSYKIGQLEISRLRRFAESELGADFDIRLFHDAVLLNGSIPLDVLGDQIELFVADQKALIATEDHSD